MLRILGILPWISPRLLSSNSILWFRMKSVSKSCETIEACHLNASDLLSWYVCSFAQPIDWPSTTVHSQHIYLDLFFVAVHPSSELGDRFFIF